MNKFSSAALMAALLLPLTASAGDLDGPGTAGSVMPTTDQIYDLLNAGTAITISNSATFTEPASGPTAGTRKTLSDIQGKLPAPDNTNGAAVSDVLTGKTFWGLRTDGTWGVKAGTLTLPVAASGAATAADVLSGVTFSSLAGAGTGTMPNNLAVSITPGTFAQAIAAGYHNGSGTVAGDTNLTAANIKPGVTIFGVTGQRTCSGTLNGTRWCDQNNGTVMDMTTGLVWLQNANCTDTLLGVDKTGGLAWDDARLWSAGLASSSCGLSDGSVMGDWRLPTKNELSGIITNTEPLSSLSPRVFSSVQSNIYWSGSTNSSITAFAWSVYMNVGYVEGNYKTFNYYVWPVRSGQ